MPWTLEEKLQALVALPWTVVPETTPEGDKLLRIAEVPSAIGEGDDDEARVTDMWASLRESLRAYLHFDDPIPLPEGYALPWVHPAPRAVAFIAWKGELTGNVGVGASRDLAPRLTQTA